MPDSFDRTAAKAAIRALLLAVPGSGAVAAWLTQGPDRDSLGRAQRPVWPYWEVTIPRVPEAQIAGPRVIEEQPVIRCEGWLPVNGNGESEAAWDALVPLVKDTLRAHRDTLAPDLTHSLGPQETENDLREYNTRSETVLCHHVVLEVEALHEFAFELA